MPESEGTEFDYRHGINAEQAFQLRVKRKQNPSGNKPKERM
jgi:hypothetical protein